MKKKKTSHESGKAYIVISEDLTADSIPQIWQKQHHSLDVDKGDKTSKVKGLRPSTICMAVSQCAGRVA